MLLAVEMVVLCLVFWGLCFLGTGSDQKNIKSFRSYPDEAQEWVRKNTDLAEGIKPVSQIAVFLSNLVTFIIVLLPLGYFVRGEGFFINFFHVLLLGEVLNAFDLLVMDLLWWRNTRRIRFSGTENMPELYRSPKKHIRSFLSGAVVFLFAALIDGGILLLF